jgi:hypothetical protein
VDYQLFLDLDGVLADFDNAVKKVTGKLPAQLDIGFMWKTLARTKDFYAQLDWMSDGRALFDAMSEYHPVILTGLPYGSWAEGQKRRWCARELGEDIEVITCMTREKPEKALAYTTKTPILIDDRLKTKDAWEDMGGIFILHRSAEESIQLFQEAVREFF